MANVNKSVFLDLDNDDFDPVSPYSVTDDRFNILNIDSTYCAVDDISFKDYKYCALHLNIHSLPSKFVELKNLLADLEHKNIHVDFILLCETFLTNANADKFSIPGYNFVHRNRQTNSRGGVAM